MFAVRFGLRICIDPPGVVHLCWPESSSNNIIYIYIYFFFYWLQELFALWLDFNMVVKIVFIA